MRVIVIGAGVIGSAIAFRLADAGETVTLIDDNPGDGASRAAAGMLTPVAEAWHGEDSLLELLVDSWRRYPRFVERVEEVSARKSGYRRTPTLICTPDAADLDALDGLHRITQAAGLNSKPLSTREARKLEPALSPRLAGAYLAEDDHQVDPRRLCEAVLSAFANQGGELLRARVSQLHHEDDSPGVRLAGGETLHADAVVVANGLAASELAPELGVMRPVHGDIMRLGPARFGPPLVSSVVRGVVNGRAVYIVPRADGSIVLGATAREDNDPRVNVGGVHTLLRDAVALLPGIVDLSLDETMARARPGTPDNMPLVGELAPGVIAATGFYRHGVLLTPWAADAVLTILGVGEPGQVAGLTDCAPNRFARASDRLEERQTVRKNHD